MRAIFGLVLLVGMGLAGFAVYMVNQYMDEQGTALQRERERANAVVQTVEIYAPSRNLTYGELLRPEDVKLIRYASANLPQDVFRTEEELFPEGVDIPRIVKIPMHVNEPIMNYKNIIALAFGLTLLSNTALAQTTSNVITDSKSNSTVNTDANSQTIVISPPPSAISPSVGSSSSDLCTVGVSGAVQTQILGISTGEMVRDANCERLKISKTLYDMGMKVAAVSVLCQDRRVYNAMEMAGTPCPFLGEIGDLATDGWKANPGRIPPVEEMETKEDVQKRNGAIAGATIGSVLLLLLLL